MNESISNKMGDVIIHCPLCCNKIFGSKQLLVEHLLNVVSNINCSFCSRTFSSLELLINHLNLENCQQPKIEHSYTFVHAHDNNELEKTVEKESFIANFEQDVPENQFQTQNEKANDADDCKVSEMFVAVEPCPEIQLETQELKFVHDLGENRYMVLTSHDLITKTNNEVLTEQNSDETPTTDIKDPETVITQSEKEAENQEETYSCNNCGVSFTSVIEHIQNYHNDHDTVVVEQEQLEEGNENETIQEADCVKKEKDTEDKKPARRVITETGNIVEAPFFVNITPQTQTIVPNQTINVNNGVLLQVQKEPVTKGKRINTKKYAQIDKFCDSVVKDIKKMEDKNGPFHKVILKEMQALEDGAKVKIYNCMSCNIYVTSLDEFQLHPCKTLKYHCPHCSVAYDNTKSLSAHMKVHKDNNTGISLKLEPDAPGPVKCEICSTVFQTNKSLKLHKRMHDPVKVRPIEPPVEPTEGTEVSNDKFLCSVCDKLIPIDYRTVHQNSHKTSSKYHCDVCNKKFNSMEYLEMHMNVHNFEKSRVNRDDKVLPYSCAFCPRKFSRPHEKVKHERIHTGEKPHSCEICGKSFRVAYCLTLHMRTHTGARPYECPHCCKRFKAHSVYNHHLLTHSDVRAYKCPFCPKAFKTSVQLAGHKNSHTKPFSCQHCNRPFASLYAVRVHTETHLRQNNLKFSCSLCGASYARTFALKDHIKQVHNKELETSETSHSSNLSTPSLKDPGWMIEEHSETDEGMQSLKDLPNDEMNDLGMNCNDPEPVMIVP